MTTAGYRKQNEPLRSSHHVVGGSYQAHRLLMEIPSRFETNRLAVRKCEEGDGEDYYNLFERNSTRELLKEHVSEAASKRSVEEAEIKVREHSAEWVAPTRFAMGIWLKTRNEYVGEIWIEPKDWDIPSFELVYPLIEGIKERRWRLRQPNARSSSSSRF